MTVSPPPKNIPHLIPDSIELGTGAWAWGDRIMWGFGKGYADADVRAAFDATLAAGITMFDTAEMYGLGASEKFLGRFMRERGQTPYIATKFMPVPWRIVKPQLISALKGSLRRLGLSSVDLYQIHWPMPPVSVETWADALADAIEQNLTRAVGVSNYSAEQTRRAHAMLAKRGFPLASNQVEYSLIQRSIERDGTMQACHELGVKIIAYSPLGMGLLTGKYSIENPPPGIRGRQYRGLLPKLPPLITLLRELGVKYGKTPAQVALNWTICKGTLPIPGAKNGKQADANAGGVGWRLSADDVTALDEMSRRL